MLTHSTTTVVWTNKWIFQLEKKFTNKISSLSGSLRLIISWNSKLGDSGTWDSETQDSETRDSGTRDSGTRDSGTRDSGTRNSKTQDSGTWDSGTWNSETWKLFCTQSCHRQRGKRVLTSSSPRVTQSHWDVGTGTQGRHHVQDPTSQSHF